MAHSRWISREIKHLDEHIEMGIIDVRSGNKVSALTNLKLASAIVKQMGINDKNGVRGIEKAGQIIKSVHKTLRPLLIEAGAIAIEAYERKKKRERKL